MVRRRQVLSLTAELVALVDRKEPDSGPEFGLTALSDDDYAHAACDILQQNAGNPLWLFAYGSLIWKPDFEHVEHRASIAHGWRRSFSLDIVRWRATREQPGLMMALDYGGSTQDGSYTKLFPSLHLNYALSANLKVRLSWAMTYGRHLTNTIAPVPSADTQARTVTAANPSLPPVVSKNTDLRFEYAFARSTGLVSLGIFEQRVHDFPTPTRTEIGIVPSGPDNGFEGNWAGYRLLAFASDGGWGIRKGAEVSYRQQLSFLPGLLRGLGVAAHYTYFESKTQYTGQPVRRENETVLLAPHSGNARFTYTWRKFSAAAGVNYRPRVPFAGATSKIRSVAMVDAGVAYRIRPQTNVYLNTTNLAREDLDDYVNVFGRMANRFPSAMILTTGVSGQF